MFYKTVEIKVDYKKAGAKKQGGFIPALDCYCFDDGKKHPALVICPGGGYAFTSLREGTPVAREFIKRGFNCFVLWYSVTGNGRVARFPSQLLELAAAVAKVRENAEQFFVDEKKIFVCGFSAGGHLAASLGTLWNSDLVKNALGFSGGKAKPAGTVLSYPVITSGEYAHTGSFEMLLGEKYGDKALMTKTSLEKQVSGDTVPAFIWHTKDDGTVPVENTLLYTAALKKHGVPFEMRLFPHGAHGLSLANDSTWEGESKYISPECAAWVDLAERWMKNL